ncbi:hypothetical protein [Streptomyces sp. C]|uniref:hypothetical protein n=1 Tax=Streptomyces sp. C TaxID=253839 RepID=UPI0001B56D6D|nr:hypothetical protein [Streptomyces sp. C]
MAMGQKTADTADADEQGRRKLDLSATQVAGSSLATVAAALLASKMGVYGTILGAGVVSVVATAGGPVIQHLFRRTGDRLRGSARPRARQVPPPGGEPGPAVPAPGEFGEATVHGTRVRGWKRTAAASGAAFALALGGLGTYEALAGTSVSSDGRTLLSGGSRTAPDHKSAPPERDRDGGGAGGTDRKGRSGGEEGRSGTEGKDGTAGTDGKTPGSGTSPSPSRSHGGRVPSPGPTPSGSEGPTEPAPTPSKQTPGPVPTPGSGGTGGVREPSPSAP